MRFFCVFWKCASISVTSSSWATFYADSEWKHRFFSTFPHTPRSLVFFFFWLRSIERFIFNLSLLQCAIECGVMQGMARLCHYRSIQLLLLLLSSMPKGQRQRWRTCTWKLVPRAIAFMSNPILKQFHFYISGAVFFRFLNKKRGWKKKWILFFFWWALSALKSVHRASSQLNPSWCNNPRTLRLCRFYFFVFYVIFFFFVNFRTHQN